MIGVLGPAVICLLPLVVLPQARDLQAAQHDEVELERVALRLGPSRLLQLAAAPGAPGTRVLALKGLGLVGARDAALGAQALLPLTELLGRTRDPRVLEAGAAVAGRLAQHLGRAALLGDEQWGDELPRATGALVRLAGDESLPGEVRAELLSAAAALPQGAGHGAEVVALARGPEPLVRLAALGALGALGLRSELAGLVAPGGDDELAAQAAAALCEVLPSKGALEAPLAERVRQLAAPQGGLQQAVRQQLGGCLRQLGTPRDRALLLGLQRGARKGGR